MQTTGLPVLTVDIDRDKAARFGLNVGDIQDTVAHRPRRTQRRYPVRGRPPLRHRHPPAGNPARRPAGTVQPADPAAAEQPGADRLHPAVGCGAPRLSRRDRTRSAGRTASGASWSAPTRAAATSARSCWKRNRSCGRGEDPAGYWTTWGGQSEQLRSAAKRLQVVVPVALLLVFTLLFAMFNNVKDGLLVFTGIPFALTGGVLALWLRGIPLSISAAVGFPSPCPGWRCSTAW
ncbi:efflux RND transporter permease subunit [Pseudomonas aeruginosa]